MKKLILLLTLASCSQETKKEINCLYQGGIIIEKHDFSNIDGSMFYYIKTKSEIIVTEVYQADKGYNVGDTINKPCLNKIK